jgi:hypothetical protein
MGLCFIKLNRNRNKKLTVAILLSGKVFKKIFLKKLAL